jgi:hypothetical protein
VAAVVLFWGCLLVFPVSAIAGESLPFSAFYVEPPNGTIPAFDLKNVCIPDEKGDAEIGIRCLNASNVRAAKRRFDVGFLPVFFILPDGGRIDSFSDWPIEVVPVF